MMMVSRLVLPMIACNDVMRDPALNVAPSLMMIYHMDHMATVL